MKKNIHLFSCLLFLFLGISATAQNLQLTVRYSIPNTRYEVYALPSTSNATFFWGPSQISIVVPASVPNADLVITSVEAGAWDDNSNAFAPGAAPGSDFHGLGSLGAPVNFIRWTREIDFPFYPTRWWLRRWYSPLQQWL
nr:hypothetical protein [Haliscomenobacter sp.]